MQGCAVIAKVRTAEGELMIAFCEVQAVLYNAKRREMKVRLLAQLTLPLLMRA